MKDSPSGPITRSTRGAVGILTLNRPEALNALTVELLEELDHGLREADANPEVRAIILAGSGDRAFCAGADLKTLTGAADKEAAVGMLVDIMHRVCGRMESIGTPVIAAIHGYCLGGGLELALAADLRVAAETARLGLPEAKIGSLPGGGGTQRLPRLIGAARAKELMFSCASVDAHEAHRIGLVNRIVSGPDPLESAVSLAAEIARQAPLSLRGIKQAVNRSLDVDLATGLGVERACHDALQDSEDRREGTRAFLEKREPIFRGR